MTKRKKMMLAGGGLVLVLAGGGVGGRAAYSNYADGRCAQDLQDVQDNAYASMFGLTGDTDESLNYRAEQQWRVLQSRWCQAGV